MKRFLVVAMFCFGSLQCNKLYAQDIHFSQFYENAILRNPALTGIFSGDYKFGLNYRSQWSEISVPFKTVLVSGESRIVLNREVGDYLSFGLTATYDRAGSINFNSMQVYPAINYNKAIEDKHNSYLSVGFAGGYIQRSIDLSKATFSTQYGGNGYDPLASSGENMSNTVIQNYDLAAGISLNSSIGAYNNVNYYLGFAGYHVTRPQQSFNKAEGLIRLDTKWTGNMGFKCNLNSQYAITVHLNYATQGQYNELIGGGLISWRTNPELSQNFGLYAGVFIRYKDAFIPTVKVDYQHYSMTISYDINTSTLKPASNGVGGFEISIFARGIYKRTQQSGEQMRCPRFEQMLQSSIESF
jgi:type IX secretion system PorP/SprF family membrane protein